MLLRFFVDADNPNRWDEDGIDSPEDSASTAYVNSRLPHQRTTEQEIFYDTFRKYCNNNMYSIAESVLIDLSDDVMFQYMMEGVQDYDFMVYNPFTEKIVISSDVYEACEAAYRTDNNTHGRGSVGSIYNSTKNIIFDWDVFHEDNKKYNDNRKLLIKCDGDFYNLIYKELKKYIQHWFNTRAYDACLKLSGVIYQIQREQGQFLGEIEKPVQLPTVYSGCEDVAESTQVANMPIDALRFIYMKYVNDDEFYLESTKIISKEQYETFRKMYTYVHKATTQSPPKQ